MRTRPSPTSAARLSSSATKCRGTYTMTAEVVGRQELRKLVTELVQKWMKSGDNDVFEKLLDLIQQNNDRCVVPGTRFLERYEGGTLYLHLHISVKGYVERLAEPVASDWCFMVSHLSGRNRFQNSPAGKDQATTRPREVSGSDVQEAMFVSVGEVSQNRERVARRIIPSCIRLQPIDDCQYVRGHAANNLRLDWLASLIGGLNVENRELRAVSHRTAVRFNQSASEVVERRSEIVKAIPDNNADTFVWLGDDVKLKEKKTIVARLDISNDFVRLAVKVVRNLTIDSAEVLLCPVELELDRPGDGHASLEGDHERREAEDAEGPRDTGSQAIGLREGSRCCGEAEEVTASPHEEVASRTSPDRSGCCNATRTRSGSPEDA